MCLYVHSHIQTHTHTHPEGHLPVGDVLGHMMNVLDSRLFGWVGMDYSYILLNNVLIVPECVVQISAHKWNGKETICC